MDYKVLIAKSARSDIREIVEYIAKDNPRAAKAFGNRIIKTIEGLSSFPRRGSMLNEIARRGKEVREVLVGQYRIIYEMREEVVHVHRVFHGARRMAASVVPDNSGDFQ